MTTRRLVISRSAALVGAASTGLLLPSIVRAQSGKVRVGFMLPYTGTFAQLGVAIENGVRLAIDQQGGKLGGREIEWFKVDDESEPSKGVENASKLVRRELEPAWIADTQRKIYSMGLWPQKLPYTDVVDVIIKEIRA